jgi:membrane protein DedA with SNARE-associated domain
VDVQQWLEHVPAVVVYVLVAVVVGVESLGIPLPGEIVLVAAALLASQQGTVDPVVLGASASAGAIAGDSTGYAIGRKGGRPLFTWLGRRFPRHFGPSHVATAERSFQRWGMWAVFFGRFVALLRIFAGPLAGVLRMRYWKFLTANALGGIVWAGGTTAVVYTIGMVAEDWLKRFSWFALIAAVLVGTGSVLFVRRRAARHDKAERDAGHPGISASGESGDAGADGTRSAEPVRAAGAERGRRDD